MCLCKYVNMASKKRKPTCQKELSRARSTIANQRYKIRMLNEHIERLERLLNK